MREYVALCCVIGLAACGGRNAGSKQDSLARDTMAIAGPPAVTSAPTPAAESIASRSRITSPSEAAGKEARKPTSVASKSPASDSRGSQAKVIPPPPAQTADTVRGIVSVVGTDRAHRVMIAPVNGGRRVEVTGSLAALIGHAAGADVWVTGNRSETSVAATRFVVRAVDGSPAIDGTLKVEGSALYIVTPDGARIRIAVPPPAFTGRDGARVWITGDPSKGVASYGFIDPPR